MNTKLLLACSSVLVLGVSACGHHSGRGSHGADAVEDSGVEVVAVSGTHTVRCGCVIEEIRHCGQGDQQAKIEGTLVDGAVVATAYELQE